MKKILFAALAMLISATAVFAQKKGEMYVSGTIGMNVGVNTLSYHSNSATTTYRNPYNHTFELSPSYGYFVADNVEINANFRYGVNSVNHYEDETSVRDGRSGTHKLTFGFGTNYYVRITKNFFYTPGIGVGLGFADIFETEGSVKSDVYCFVFGLGLDLGKFDVRVNRNFGITFNMLRMDYELMSRKVGNEDRVNSNNLAFTTGVIGLKYYF